jgi:hypothetical protein
MTQPKNDNLTRLGGAVSERGRRIPKGHRYSAEAVQREIDKDRRIGPVEARLIHALLRGRD